MKIKRILLALCLTVFFTGCERTLQVTLDGKNPPTFKFNGSGEIAWVFIYQVTPEGKVPPKGSAFWRLVPKETATASAAPPITYDVVPEGFVQEVPANGSPPPLQEGKTYGFGADTRGQPGNDLVYDSGWKSRAGTEDGSTQQTLLAAALRIRCGPSASRLLLNERSFSMMPVCFL